MMTKRAECLRAVNACVWMADVGILVWWLLEWMAGR